MENIKIAFYDSHSYDRQAFEALYQKFGFEIEFFDFKLNQQTVFSAKGHQVVCIFVNDFVDENVVLKLKEFGVSLIALRCAGFNNVDVPAAKNAGITVVRVPSYSPNAVAEHAVALLLSLTRHLPQAYIRTKSGNFTLDGLTGRDLCGLTAGILGTGRIGRIMAQLLKAFGMKVILYDPHKDNDWACEHGFEYKALYDFFRESDVISLHCPLNAETFHIVNEDAFRLMKTDAVIINTGRGALIDSKALVHALKHKKIGGAALDVYEEESKYFYNDWSAIVIDDDVLARLMSFPNVMITSHQGFLTQNALENIAQTTLTNIKNYFGGKTGVSVNDVLWSTAGVGSSCK